MHTDKPILYILTAVYREQNLGLIADSIRQHLDDFQVVWLPIFNTPAGNWHAGGKYNLALDILHLLPAGWVYFLDDDNLIHPEFASGLMNAIARNPGENIFIFRQYRKDGSVYLDRPLVEPNRIDTGCFVAHSMLMHHPRWILSDFPFDFGFIERMCGFAAREYSIKPINCEGATYYNAITGAKTAPTQEIPPGEFDKQLRLEKERYPWCK